MTISEAEFDDLELLVYSSVELNLNIDIPVYEMEISHSIQATFTTKEVLKAVSLLHPKACLVEREYLDSPYVKVRKMAPNEWEVILAGNSQAIQELLETLHGIQTPRTARWSVCGVKASNFESESVFLPLKNWQPCSGPPKESLLTQMPPESASEMMQVPEPDDVCDERPQSAEILTEAVLVIKNKVSFIIGPGGCRVTQVRQSTGCTISIPSIEPSKLQQMRGLPASEVVQEVILKGTAAQIALAKSMIRRMLSDYEKDC